MRVGAASASAPHPAQRASSLRDHGRQRRDLRTAECGIRADNANDAIPTTTAAASVVVVVACLCARRGGAVASISTVDLLVTSQGSRESDGLSTILSRLAEADVGCSLPTAAAYRFQPSCDCNVGSLNEDEPAAATATSAATLVGRISAVATTTASEHVTAGTNPNIRRGQIDGTTTGPACSGAGVLRPLLPRTSTSQQRERAQLSPSAACTIPITWGAHVQITYSSVAPSASVGSTRAASASALFLLIWLARKGARCINHGQPSRALSKGLAPR